MNRNLITKFLVTASICLSAVVLASCGSGITVPDDYNYDDLSKYITVAKYKGIEYNKTDIQVTQQEIMDYIDTERAENATTSNIKSGTVNSDSVANIDYVGKIDGVEFDGGSATSVELDMSSNNFIDGFAAGVLGHSVGETFDVNVTFPSNYSSADLAGKDAVFTITVNYLVEKKIPEYNESYVKKYTDYSSMEKYEKAVKKQLKEQKESEQETADRLTVFNTIVDSSELKKKPSKEYKKRYNSYIENYESQAEQNDTDLETYVGSVMGISMDEFYNDAEVYAEKVVKQELVLNYIARKEKIDISDSEYEEYVEELLDSSGYTVKTYESTYGVKVADMAESNNLYSKLLYNRVMDKVMEYSKKVEVK